MEIRNKNYHDPVTDVPQVEAYMRYALLAAEEMLGQQKLEHILRSNDLDRLIDNYPPERIHLTRDITHKDYTNLCVAVMQSYGKDSKNAAIKFGRISTKPAIEKQGKIFNFTAKAAVRLLPTSAQIKIALESIISDLEKIYQDTPYDVGVKLEDRGDRWAYVDPSCALCAGKESDSPICWTWAGTIAESLSWLTGKEFDIDQTECRAMGKQYCVWEIAKTPKKTV